MEHVLPEHDGKPLFELHAFPQPPQLFTFDDVSVSQPLLGLLSQLPYVPLHTGTQLVPLQLVVPCALLQAFPQLPQFVRVVVLVSQPVDAVASQSP
jgi:hypothetical protein